MVGVDRYIVYAEDGYPSILDLLKLLIKGHYVGLWCLPNLSYNWICPHRKRTGQNLPNSYKVLRYIYVNK